MGRPSGGEVPQSGVDVGHEGGALPGHAHLREEARPAADKPPRRPKPVAQRWARTQADGPRDGSESHHAAPITARPIYAPGRRGPITDEWSPGETK